MTVHKAHNPDRLWVSDSSSSAMANVVSVERDRPANHHRWSRARPSGPSAVLDFAVVSRHDAIQAYAKNVEPYAVSILNAAGCR
jgi:hypothetical protein